MVSSIKITAPDGSVWFTPVTDVAVHKANHLAKQQKTQAMFVLVQTVFPEFEKDPNQVIAWAKGYMKPEDFNLIKLQDPKPLPKESVLKDGKWSVS